MNNNNIGLVAKAYINFCKVYWPDEPIEKLGNGFLFWNFLGLERPPRAVGLTDWILDQQTRDKCQALAGPHYYAIAKAMELNGAVWDKPCKYYEP